jgi:glycosyltransferase involved in cell wall biosynthesis
MKIELSYIIATYNRLSFLKITLEKLMANLQPDEEIVVVDGNSTDGTKEYLQQLFEKGKIHQFISEPDMNQAHAWNKAMLMAKGTLIKKIIDDDVFDYQSIRKCKDHMLQHPLVDVVLSNDVSSLFNDHQTIHTDTRIPEFEKWCKGLLPSFSFGDVHMLIRRSSLSYIGLYNTAYVMMDWEYSLRISYLKANIVYYTGYNALSVAHPQTITSSANKQLINFMNMMATTAI